MLSLRNNVVSSAVLCCEWYRRDDPLAVYSTDASGVIDGVIGCR